MSEVKTATSTMKLPHAVRQTAERIAEMERKAKEAKESEESTATAEPTASVEEASPAAEAKPVSVQKEHDEGYWERRASVIQGYLEKANRDIKEQKSAFEKRLEALEDQLVETANKVPKVYDIRKYIGEKELEELDEKQLAAAVKIAVQATAEDLKLEVKRHVDPLKQELEHARADAEKSRYHAFLADVRREVPNLEVLDKDPEFITWLKQKAPFSKTDRLTLLRQAEAEQDAETVIEFFKAFESSKPAPAKKPELKPHVDPMSSPTPSSTSSSTGAPIMKRSQITKFYEDVRRGRIKEGSKDYQDFERRYALASKHNTIVEG